MAAPDSSVIIIMTAISTLRKRLVFMREYLHFRLLCSCETAFFAGSRGPNIHRESAHLIRRRMKPPDIFDSLYYDWQA